MFKTATCGCCTKWVEHLRANGFTVEAVNVENLAAVKQAHGVPRSLGSCHTAVVERLHARAVPALLGRVRLGLRDRLRTAVALSLVRPQSPADGLYHPPPCRDWRT